MARIEQHYLDPIRDKAKRVLRFVILFSLASNILMLALPLYSLQVLDRVLSSRSMDTLFLLTFIAVFAFIFLGVFYAVRQFITERLGQWIDEQVAPDILRNTVTLSSQQISAQGTQNMRDLNQIKQFLISPGFQTLMDLPWAPLFLIIIVAINPWLGAVASTGGLILVCFALFNEYATKKLTAQVQQENLEALRVSDAANSNAEAIEAMGMMERIVSTWRKANKKVVASQTRLSERASIINSISKSARMLIQISIMATGALLAINNQMSIGGMIAASILTGRALAPLEAVITMWKSALMARDSYTRLNESLSRPPVHRGTMNLPVPTGRLSVENLVFRPPDRDTLVLKNVSFTLEPGDTLGVIGASAAGKSTLAKLLVGVWPALSGKVRLDGVDVYKWAREDFGKYVGYLPQEVDLFPGTIKDNIARMDLEASDEAVVEAAKTAGVHNMILQFPDGYESEVHRGLSTLSPGQKQRIALARALYGNPKFLVLDEPNSNLDGDGEHALIQALLRAKEKGMTIVCIAHKPSLVAHLDKILMLRGGIVESFGTKEEVLPRYIRGGGAGGAPAQSAQPGQPAQPTASTASAEIAKVKGDL